MGFQKSASKNQILALLIILSIFIFLDQFATQTIKFLFPELKGYARWGTQMVFEVSGCLLTVMTLYRTNPLEAVREMGFSGSFWFGFLFAFLATLPTSLTFAFGSQ